MAFALDFPRGWTTVNQKSQVGAISSDETALVVLTVEAGETDAERALSTFLRQDDVRGSGSRRTSVNGRPGWEASFSADAEGGGLRGAVLFVEHGERSSACWVMRPLLDGAPTKARCSGPSRASAP